MFDTNLSQEAVLRETEKAICVEICTGYTQFGGRRQVWFPKSQIEWRTSPGQSHFAPTLHIPYWLADKTF